LGRCLTDDAVGNRLQMTSTLSAVPAGTFSYDNNDRLTTDTYDVNGNTVSSAGIANTYDFENHMLAHRAVTMVYDGDGKRVSETVGGTTTKYLVDELNPTGYTQVMDKLVNGSVTRTYAYGLQRISENQLISGTWTPSFYGYDGHGTVRFLANTSGTITDTYTFDAFGMPITTSGTTPNNFLYSGEQYDSNLNLYHLRARYYNPAAGRFETMDPRPDCMCEACKADPLGWHKHPYAASDPVNRIDPTGRAGVAESYLIYAVFFTGGGSNLLWDTSTTESGGCYFHCSARSKNRMRTSESSLQLDIPCRLVEISGADLRRKQMRGML
jgi:RHS repeat-associated protein